MWPQDLGEDFGIGVSNMSDAIIVAIISGGLSLCGVVISNIATARKTEASIITAQAVTDTKLEELTREVREHNNFAVRMPAFEQRIRELERRVGVLETYHKGPTN